MLQRLPALARQDFIHQIILLIKVIILMIQKTKASTGIRYQQRLNVGNTIQTLYIEVNS